MTTCIKLPVFFQTEEASELEDLGVAFSEDNYFTKDVYFFEISALWQYSEEHPEYTSIMSGSTEYIIKMPWKKIMQMINQSNTFLIYLN